MYIHVSIIELHKFEEIEEAGREKREEGAPWLV